MHWFEMGRAGVWYTDNITVENSTVVAPKNFRRCNGVTLRHVEFPNAEETLWSCRNVTLDDVAVHGDYFAMNCEDMKVDGLRLVGGYSFDGARNVEISNSRLITKDAFWNSENVTVRDSFITSEYLGWNARNLTLINCTIESLQGLCYIDNLVMRGCQQPYEPGVRVFDGGRRDRGAYRQRVQPRRRQDQGRFDRRGDAGSGAHRPRGHRHRDHGALSASRGARRPRLAVAHRHAASWQGTRTSRQENR